jgi:hypothetical protein
LYLYLKLELAKPALNLNRYDTTQRHRRPDLSRFQGCGTRSGPGADGWCRDRLPAKPDATDLGRWRSWPATCWPPHRASTEAERTGRTGSSARRSNTLAGNNTCSPGTPGTEPAAAAADRPHGQPARAPTPRAPTASGSRPPGTATTRNQARPRPPRRQGLPSSPVYSYAPDPPRTTSGVSPRWRDRPQPPGGQQGARSAASMVGGRGHAERDQPGQGVC